MELYVQVIKPLIGFGHNVANLEHKISCLGLMVQKRRTCQWLLGLAVRMASVPPGALCRQGWLVPGCRSVSGTQGSSILGYKSSITPCFSPENRLPQKQRAADSLLGIKGT